MSHLPPQGPAGQWPATQPAPWAAYGAPQGWAPPRAWGPPQGWVPGWAPARPSPGFNWSRLLPTLGVAFIIGAVLFGGIGLDAAIAAPSAGLVTIGGSVTMTAGPGWVLATSEDDTATSGIELRKAGAVLTAEIASTTYSGDSAAMLAGQEESLTADTGQISYGDPETTSVNGHDTTYVVFEATVTSGQRTGVLDGELICMVVDGNAVVILVASQQGHLDPVIDDVTAMLRSVGTAR